MDSKADTSEYEDFNFGMDVLLKADPARVKAQMERDKRIRAEGRAAKRASSAPASNDRD